MNFDITSALYNTYWDDYEGHYLKNNINLGSLVQRKSTIKAFFAFLNQYGNKPDFKDIERSNIKLYILERKKTCAPRTINREFSFLKHFFVYHDRENQNRIFDNWIYSTETTNHSEFLTISNEESKKMYRHIRSYVVSEQSFRLEIAFLLLIYTGCKKDELCNLNIYKEESAIDNHIGQNFNYISLTNKCVYFSKVKNGNKVNRVIPLSEKIVNRIEKYLDFMSEQKGIDFETFPFLFPSTYDQSEGEVARLNSDQLNAGIKNLLNECKILEKKISFQAFRNTFIKNLADNNIPISIIKDLTGLDISSLKRYFNVDEYQKERKEEILSNLPLYKSIDDDL